MKTQKKHPAPERRTFADHPQVPTPGSAEGDLETVEADLRMKRDSADMNRASQKSEQNEWADSETRRRRAGHSH